jgi:hypothetical protein
MKDTTPLADAAVAIHEMFLSYVAAGFTEQQALYLIAQQMAVQPPQAD